MTRLRARLWRTAGTLVLLLAIMAGCSGVQRVADRLETAVGDARSAVVFDLAVLRLVDHDRLSRAAALVSCTDAADQVSSATHDAAGLSITDQPSRELRDRALAALHEAGDATLAARDDLRLRSVSAATVDRLTRSADRLSRLHAELLELR